MTAGHSSTKQHFHSSPVFRPFAHNEADDEEYDETCTYANEEPPVVAGVTGFFRASLRLSRCEKNVRLHKQYKQRRQVGYAA